MSGIVEWYKDLMYNKNDPRTNDWFLISSPGPIIMIVVTYIYFSVSAGPRYMRDRKPYELRNTMILYNFLQVLISMYLFYEGSVAGWLNGYSFTCQPTDFSDDPKALRMARAVHLYFICKLIELLDTVFFVLRKKTRQVTFLHLYHHAMMPICAWIGVRFYPGGHPTFLGYINTFIHVIMYAYYLLSSFGPHMEKYLWWKKYLTTLQLIQFLMIFFHNVQILFNGCNFPKILASLLVVNSVLFIYLFGSFYVENYMKESEKRQALANGGDARSTQANGTSSIKSE